MKIKEEFIASLNDHLRAFYPRFRLKEATEGGIRTEMDQLLKNFKIENMEIDYTEEGYADSSYFIDNYTVFLTSFIDGLEVKLELYNLDLNTTGEQQEWVTDGYADVVDTFEGRAYPGGNSIVFVLNRELDLKEEEKFTEEDENVIQKFLGDFRLQEEIYNKSKPLLEERWAEEVEVERKKLENVMDITQMMKDRDGFIVILANEKKLYIRNIS